MNRECLLATLPGSCDTERVVVVLVQLEDDDSRISLRQQNWAEGIGWYDQKSLDLEPEQYRQLRRGLGAAAQPRRALTESDAATLPFPGVVRTESA
jgi:hypothetical protein